MTLRKEPGLFHITLPGDWLPSRNYRLANGLAGSHKATSGVIHSYNYYKYCRLDQKVAFTAGAPGNLTASKNMASNKASVFTVQKEHIVYWKSNEYKMYVGDKKVYFLFKRVFDIVFSFFFLVVVLSWLVPLIAICIKLDSPGPVFFIQNRVGKAGGNFFCYKFRSMILNPEAHNRHAARNDQRITRFGKFLRRSNMDEFPQFLNVLKGDMSIVGPRPHMHADHRTFASAIPGYDFRNLLRPGMTGLAQIKGFSGPAETRESIFGRYQWDAFYIRNASIFLDIRILRKTIQMEFAWLAEHFTSLRSGSRIGNA